MKDGGSALLFANDGDEKLYYVAFTSTSTAQWRGDAHIFVVDASGAVRTEIAVRRAYWSQVAAGLYRALPSKSVYGEARPSPSPRRTLPRSAPPRVAARARPAGTRRSSPSNRAWRGGGGLPASRNCETRAAVVASGPVPCLCQGGLPPLQC